ncbi:GNAT family N-acetyltransferase [Chloroflexota bacterium]
MENKLKVSLSPLEDEHIYRYMSLSDDPQLIATMGWSPFHPGEKERFIQFTEVLSVPHLDGAKAVVFSIISRADGKAIGYISIKGIDEKEASAEVGIAIMEREYRGHGYGSEALAQVVDYAFNKLHLTLLSLTVFLSNKPAIRVYEKVGFRKVKILKNSWLLPNGEYSDTWLMELSRDLLP